MIAHGRCSLKRWQKKLSIPENISGDLKSIANDKNDTIRINTYTPAPPTFKNIDFIGLLKRKISKKKESLQALDELLEH